MGYRTLKQCVVDLEQAGHLIRLDEPVDAHLEAAEIQRRVFQSGGPAVFFSNIKRCRHPMVSNLFGTMERVRYMFRDRLDAVRRLVELKLEPARAWRRPGRYLRAWRAALATIPRRCRTGPILAHRTTIDRLPQLVSWPDDGGAFITLPVVYTEDVTQPGLGKSNLGMYRVQLSGGRYQVNREIGLHYQIQRGIAVHHAAALGQGKPLRVNIFVGGAPAMAVAAVMPLPEGVSELPLAGALAGHRIPMICRPGELPIYAEADFCITGVLDAGRVLPEGPFGDHLGYYSLAHDFPVMRVEHVYHRDGAIWPFTVVGRPPQEDTMFGRLIHELTAPIVPAVIPGVHQVHAVDAAGVHPLMLAVGSERYAPYRERQKPQELLTQAHAILGQGQMSLAKYLMIVAREDASELDACNIPDFFAHLLSRVDWRRDLHFQTATTIDTLDYSGTGLNEGSKLIIAAAGGPVRELPTQIGAEMRLPDGFRGPRVCLPGVLAVAGPPAAGVGLPAAGALGRDDAVERFAKAFTETDPINRFPLVVIVDDSDFTARCVNNFLWVAFTRSNPAADVYGVASFVDRKHWGARGSLVIDARIKPHHAPPLVENPEVTRKIDAMAARGGPLAKYL